MPSPSSSGPGDEPAGRFQPPHVRRRQVLDAGARLIVAHGFDGMTMEQVANEAGIAKGTVYLYFPSKQALLSGMQSDLAQVFLDGPLELMADERSTWAERLDALARSRLVVRLTHRDLYHELFHEQKVSAGEEPLAQARALLAEILARGTLAGEFDVPDPDVTADFLLAAAGGACDHVDRNNPDEMEATVALVQLLFRRAVGAATEPTGNPAGSTPTIDQPATNEDAGT
jgi:AcrR family transcriptional regulator